MLGNIGNLFVKCMCESQKTIHFVSTKGIGLQCYVYEEGPVRFVNVCKDQQLCN